MRKKALFFQGLCATASWLIFVCLAGCNLPAEGNGPGPAAWIDRPLEGDVVPTSQSVTILAHASDADGVARFEFFASDSQLSVVPAGDKRLGKASLEWQPPAPGDYLLGVRAEDSAGNKGAMATVRITVSGASGETITPTPAPASEESPTPTPAPARVDSPTPTPALASSLCKAGSLVAPALLSPANGTTVAAPPSLAWSYPDSVCHPYNFTVDIAKDSTFADISLGFGTKDHNETSRSWPLPEGKCYYWRVSASVPQTKGPPSSAWKFCVGASTTSSEPTFILAQNANCRLGPGTVYDSVDAFPQGGSLQIKGRNQDSSWLWVQRPTGSGQCWVSVSVGTPGGNWQTLPVVKAPSPPVIVTVTVEAPEPAPVDTTPPEISGLSVSPSVISAATHCGDTPATAVVSAGVVDGGGVSRVVARVPGQGEFEMHPSGGVYQASIGPFSEAGTLSIIVQAQDNAGNGATGNPLTLQVVSCPG
ncbi:MAG: hypothetical protein GYA15_01560 [Leptolinea sp.]|nr:hypothetical protein [Leptolinea sp.]